MSVFDRCSEIEKDVGVLVGVITVFMLVSWIMVCFSVWKGAEYERARCIAERKLAAKLSLNCAAQCENPECFPGKKRQRSDSLATPLPEFTEESVLAKVADMIRAQSEADADDREELVSDIYEDFILLQKKVRDSRNEIKEQARETRQHLAILLQQKIAKIDSFVDELKKNFNSDAVEPVANDTFVRELCTPTTNIKWFNSHIKSIIKQNVKGNSSVQKTLSK